MSLVVVEPNVKVAEYFAGNRFSSTADIVQRCKLGLQVAAATKFQQVLAEQCTASAIFLFAEFMKSYAGQYPDMAFDYDELIVRHFQQVDSFSVEGVELRFHAEENIARVFRITSIQGSLHFQRTTSYGIK